MRVVLWVGSGDELFSPGMERASGMQFSPKQSGQMAFAQSVSLSARPEPAQPPDRLLPVITMRDDSGEIRHVSIGWLILAYNIFGVAFLLGTSSGDAFYYLAGGILATLVSMPVWRWRPRYLLIAFALYLVLEDALLGPFAQHVVFAKSTPDVVIFVVLVWRILARLRQGRFFLSGIEFPLAALLLIAAVSTVVNHTPFGIAGQGVYTLLRYSVVFMLAAQSRFTAGDLRALIRTVTFFAMAESAIGLLQYVLLRTMDFQLFGYFFVQGTSSYFNVLGAFLAIASVLALTTYTTQIVPRPRIELCVLLAMSSLTITLALSRQSLGMLAIGWIIAGVLGRKKTPLIQLWQPLACTIGGIAIGTLLILAASRSLLQQQGARTPTVPDAAHIAHTAASAHLLAADLSVLPALPGDHRAPVVTATPDLTGTVTPAPTPTASSGSGQTSSPGGQQQPQASQVYQATLEGKLKQFSANFFSANFYDNARMYEIVNGSGAILERSPLVGLGPGTFGGQSTFHDVKFYQRLNVGLLLSDPNQNYVTDVEWMSIFGQLGLLGLLAFLWMFVALFRVVWRIYRTQPSDTIVARAALVGVALVPMFLFAGFTGPNYELRMVVIWLWLITGMVVAASRQGHIIRLDQPLLAQLKAPTTVDEDSNEADLTAALIPPDAMHRPATWKRVMPPRWNPAGPSGPPPVPPFWENTPGLPLDQ